MSVELSARRDPRLELAFLSAAAIGNGAPGLGWVIHAAGRLDAGERVYGDRWARRSLVELLDELLEEAADLGAWAALAVQLDDLAVIDPACREQVAGALATAAAAGAHGHAALSAALRGLEEQAR